MKYLTEPLYKKMQLFQLPVEPGMTLDDLEILGLEADDFLLQELLARDEWYDQYLPEPLHSRLFDAKGEVSLQQLDSDLLAQIAQFRQRVEQEWAKAMQKAQQEKRQLWRSAAPQLRRLLELELADSEIRRITGINGSTVQIELYPQWDLGKILTLSFTGVKDSWMSRFHPDDANWWLVDEIGPDAEREDRYVLQALFGNADHVGQLQFTFSGVQVSEREDRLDF